MQPHTVISTVIKADFELGWSELWRKAYETTDFIEGLDSCEITEKKENLVIRKMKVKGVAIDELIVRDTSSHTIYFHCLEESDVHGLIYNKIYKNKKGEVVLEYGTDAHTKDGSPFPPLELFNFVLDSSKKVIEKKAQ